MTSSTPQVILYDTTLRDGTQQEGISLTVKDKLDITTRLDDLGIHIIEGGWPFSNPKDEEYFRRVKGLNLKTARVAAFGSTRRAGIPAEQDGNLLALIASEAPIVTLVGKTWDLHVTEVLETSLEENVLMISDSISYLKSQGREAHFDAEHFFDGYAANPDYAVQCLKAAQDAGADVIHLCDTNGGVLPQRLGEVVDALRSTITVPLGIHVHNDGELAVANSMTAVEHGIEQVQGTVNGYGERCGNANLCSIIPGLQTKMGIRVVTDEQLKNLTTVSQEIAEIVNMGINPSQPYVGARAFTHKGGLHAAAVAKVKRSYEHMDPDTVGNARRIVVSELSGRSNVLAATQAMGIDVEPDTARSILEQVKNAEAAGFQYEGAEASFEMLVRRALPDYTPAFMLQDFMTVVETWRRRPSINMAEDNDDPLSEAVVKVRVGEEQYHTAAEGNGPVNALDEALRKALVTKFPEIGVVRLTDYKVRILNQESATAATVRVLIESTDGDHVWRTVGSHTNIIHASWMALADSLEYWLLNWGSAARAAKGA
ncbi:MAG: citramalate synthase [Chloroflexi bacterium]|nr:citramalate synthase [Chloroflexota bacterium]